MLEQQNALILWGNQDTSQVNARGYDAVSNSFTSSTSIVGLPTGFDIGPNLAMIWYETHEPGWSSYVYVYDRQADHWVHKSYFNASNNIWQFTFTQVSDSLALALMLSEIGPQQLQCEIYNLTTGAWESSVLGITTTYDPEQAPKAALSNNMAVVYDDNDYRYYDYIWVYAADTVGWEEFRLPYSLELEMPIFGTNFLLFGA